MSSDLTAHDSDDEALTSTLRPGFARKPRNMVNLPFYRSGPSHFPIVYVVVKHAQFRTFRAVPHYLTTFKISFSCLLSGRAKSTRGRMESGHLAASPKSVMRLVRQLGLTKLEKMARKDLASQIGPGNWVDKACSPAAAENEEIKEMLWDALQSQRLALWTAAAVQDAWKSGDNTRAAGTEAAVPLKEKPSGANCT